MLTPFEITRQLETSRTQCWPTLPRSDPLLSTLMRPSGIVTQVWRSLTGIFASKKKSHRMKFWQLQILANNNTISLIVLPWNFIWYLWDIKSVSEPRWNLRWLRLRAEHGLEPRGADGRLHWGRLDCEEQLGHWVGAVVLMVLIVMIVMVLVVLMGLQIFKAMVDAAEDGGVIG